MTLFSECAISKHLRYHPSCTGAVSKEPVWESLSKGLTSLPLVGGVSLLDFYRSMCLSLSLFPYTLYIYIYIYTYTPVSLSEGGSLDMADAAGHPLPCSTLTCRQNSGRSSLGGKGSRAPGQRPRSHRSAFERSSSTEGACHCDSRYLAR